MNYFRIGSLVLSLIAMFLNGQAQTFSTASSTIPLLYYGTIATGDLDNDGAMDLVVMGNSSNSTSGTPTARVYLKRNGSYSQVSSPGLTGMIYGDIALTDIDNDGYLDAIITGLINTASGSTTTSTYSTKVYRNNHNGTFTVKQTLSTGLGHGNVDVADVNRDGFSDFLVTGVNDSRGGATAQLILYTNNKNFSFTAVNPGIQGVTNGVARLGDFNNDGYADVLVTGNRYYNSSMFQGYSGLYQNNGDLTFTHLNLSLPSAGSGSCDWGDYDSDGNQDFAIAGYDSHYVAFTRVYHNEGNGTFVDISGGSTLIGSANGRVLWGDYNNDGKPDLLAGGRISNNNGNGSFSLAPNCNLDDNNTLTLADFNQDGSLDIATYSYVSGYVENKLYTNTTTTLNAAPAAPSNVSSWSNGNDVLFRWDAASDDKTTANGLSYNLMIGTSSGAINQMSPQASTSTGVRLLSANGNAGPLTWQLLNLPNGTYYWKVQAVDASLSGGSWSSQGIITVPGTSTFVYINSVNTVSVCQNGTVKLPAISFPSGGTFQWYKNGAALPDGNVSTYWATQPGDYYVTCTVGGRAYQSVNTITVTGGTTVGLPNATGAQGCVGTQMTLKATPGSNATSCRWYTSSGNYLSTGDSIRVNPGQTTVYKVASWNDNTSCGSNMVQVTATVLSTPGTPAGNANQTACTSSNMITLSASSTSPNSTVNWYSNAQGTMRVGTGNSISIYNVNGSVTYYAGATDNYSGCSSRNMLAITGTVYVPPAAPQIQPMVVCATGNVTIRPPAPPSGITYKWYTTPTGGSPVHQGASFSFYLSADTVFYVTSYESSGVCESETRTPAAVFIEGITDAPIAQNVTGYGTCRVPLFATVPDNATTVKWYSDAALTHYLATGQNYLTPTISRTTSYWVVGYNETAACSSGVAKQVQAIINTAPTLVVNPDNVYPIPANSLTEAHKDVNLFTGDVNLTFPLYTIKSSKLSYSLNAFYNSRSASLTPVVSNTTLGGLGWKLMDYPKIVYDQTKVNFYFLDGLAAYKLDTVSNTGGNITFSCPGKYYNLSVVMYNTSTALSYRHWSVENGEGEKFEFNTSGHYWGSTTQGYCWDISKLVDTQHTDSLTFSYDSNGHLQTIVNPWSEKIQLNYSSSRISSLDHYDCYTNSSVYSDRLVFNYKSGGYAPDNSKSILSEIQTLVNVNASSANQTATSMQLAPSTKFIYSTTKNPGALETIISPSGASRSYSYTPVSYNSHTYYPVNGVYTDVGNQVNYQGKDTDVLNPEAYTFRGMVVSSDNYYLNANEAVVIPGENRDYALFGDAETSFEDGSKDKMFPDLEKDDISKEYSLNGTHSVFFDGFGTMTLTSQRYALTRSVREVSQFEQSISNPVSEQGSLDSLTLTFFCLQTHEHLDVDFWLYFNFYDSNGNRISNYGASHENYELQNEDYGQWLPFTLRFAVPSNAVSFDFEFSGGSAGYGYDFYMDEVTITGAENWTQGELQYYFFNGKNSTSLRHLPDAYSQNTSLSSLKKVYYTGFESGQTFSSWLTFTHNLALVKPNMPDRHISYNGTFALDLADNKGNNTTVSASAIPIVAGTTHVLVSFHYSLAQFSGLIVEFSSKFNNTSEQSTTITLDGSYLLSNDYTYYQNYFAVPSGATSFTFTLKTKDAGPKSNVNDFFIDDFTIQLLNLASIPSPLTTTNNLLRGQCYYKRTFTDGYTELNTESKVLAIATLANGASCAQLKELNGSSRSAPHSGIETVYNTSGYPVSATSLWARTNPDSTLSEVWTRTHFTYASELWSAMGSSGLNLLNEIAATWAEVSDDYQQTWVTIAGDATQWNTFTVSGKSIWSKWREFELLAPATPTEIQSVISSLGNQYYTPPATTWQRSTQVNEINLFGNYLSTTIGDSVQTWSQYSLNSFTTNNKNIARQAVPFTNFLNGSSGTCYYTGFEVYEPSPMSLSVSPVSTYANTGQRSVGNTSISFQFPWNPAGGFPTTCVMGAYVMTQATTVTFTVTPTGSTAITHNFTIPQSDQKLWKYYEFSFTLPSTATTLTFQVSSGSYYSYIDDFRFSTATAEMKASVFDPFSYRTTAGIGNNGDVMRMLYGYNEDPKVVTGPGDAPLNVSIPFYSRFGMNNAGNFSADQPNALSEIQVKGTGTYYGFNDESTSQNWTITLPNGGGGTVPLKGLSILSGGSASLKTTSIHQNKNDFGLSFSLIPGIVSTNSNTQMFGLDLGSAGIGFEISNSSTQSISIYTKSGSNSWVNNKRAVLPGSVSMPYQIDVDIVCQNGIMTIWLNGEILTGIPAYSSSQFTKLQFFINGGSEISSLDINNLVFYDDAVVSAQFTDGEGHTIQEQLLTEQGIVVSERVYDRINRPILITKQVAFPNSGPGFRPTFITQMNWNTGYMTGDVNNAGSYVENGSQDMGYLYWRNMYLRSPETKISQMFNPGYDFALRSATNWEKAKKWFYNNTDKIIEYGGYVLQVGGYILDAVDCVLEPEMAPLIIAMDAADLIVTVAQIVDEYGSSTSDKIQNSPVTHYFYDDQQNIQSIRLPNANDTDDPSEKQVVTYGYDFRNHVRNEVTPESKRVNYMWSHNDLIRFYANANDSVANRIQYVKYDRMERVIEKGWFTGRFNHNMETLKQHANDPGYPGSSVSHTIVGQWSYDGYGTTNYGSYLNRGRLTSAKVFENGVAVSTITYTYDYRGRAIAEQQEQQTVSYTYNNADEIITITYPPFNGKSFVVKYSYHKSGQTDSLFTYFTTSPTPETIATWSYNPDGQIAAANLNCSSNSGSIPLKYYYNAPGWPTAISAGETGKSMDDGEYDFSTNYYSLRLDYNYLDDWWSDLWGQAYYNGNLASSKLTPSPNAPNIHSHEQGYNYDELNHLDSYFSSLITDELPDGYYDAPVEYTFDLNGNILHSDMESNTNSGGIHGTSNAGIDWRHHYDDNFNRAKYVSLYIHSDRNPSGGDGGNYVKDTVFLGYDDAGNLISRTAHLYNSVTDKSKKGSLKGYYTRTYTYSLNNEIATVEKTSSHGGDTLITFYYNALNQIRSKSLKIGNANPITTTLVRDLNGRLIAEWHSTGAGNWACYYVYSGNQVTEFVMDYGYRQDSYFVLPDNQGTPVALVSRSNKSVSAAFSFDIYGNLLKDKSYQPGWYNVLYTGVEYDYDAGLYLFPYRAYDPWLKTFTTPDYGDDDLGVPYAYTGFNPVNYTDPDGLTRLHSISTLSKKLAIISRAVKAGTLKLDMSPGELIKLLNSKTVRGYANRAEFIYRLESRAPGMLTDLQTMLQTDKYAWKKLKKILRDKGLHEMAPVSKIARSMEIGLKCEDVQKWTFKTGKTYFEELVSTTDNKGVTTVAWSGKKIGHGKTGSPAAHGELFKLLDDSVDRDDYIKNLTQWMAGTYPGQQYRLHPSTYNLLPAPPATAPAGTLRFFK